MSDTPRTDAEALNYGRILFTWGPETGKSTEILPADFARQLERENAELSKQLEQAEARIVSNYAKSWELAFGFDKYGVAAWLRSNAPASPTATATTEEN